MSTIEIKRVQLKSIPARVFRLFFNKSKKECLVDFIEWGYSGDILVSQAELYDLYNDHSRKYAKLIFIDDEEVKEIVKVVEEADASVLVKEIVEVKEVKEEVVEVFEVKDLYVSPFNRDSMKYFLNDISRRIDCRTENYVSMTGGKYTLDVKEIDKMRLIASCCYSERVNYYLVEKPTENFPFYLDIEDKSLNICFDEYVLEEIYNRLYEIFTDIFEVSNKEMTYKLVSRNSKFWDYKVHIIFPNIIVNRVTYNEIISLLKDNLVQKLSETIDDSAKSLRMLGASKPMKNLENGQVLYPKQQGVYLPDEEENNNSKYQVRRNNDSIIEFKDNITVEMLEKYSIRTNKKLTVLKSSSMFYQYLEDRKKDSHFDKYIETFDEEKQKQLVPYLVKLLKPYRSVKYFYWLCVGQIIFDLLGSDGLPVFIEFSSQSDEHKESYEEASKRLYKTFEESDKASFTMLINMTMKDNYHELINLLQYDKKEEYEEKLNDYIKPIINQSIIKCESDLLSIRYDRYVNKDIYEEANSKCILVKAPLGKGKSTSIINYLKDHPELSFCWLVPRIAHGRGIFSSLKEKKIDVRLYSDVHGEIYNNKVVVQYESLHRIGRKYDLFICDEIESVYHQSVCKHTNKDNIDQNIYKFEDLMKTSKRLFFSDAFLQKRTLNMLDMFKIDFKLFEYRTKNVKRECVMYNDYFSWFNELKDMMEEKKKIFLFSSSLSEMEKLYQNFDEETKKYVRKYSSRDGNIELTDINKQWGDDVQLVMCTSTITIGVDCQIPFDEIFCFHTNQCGVLTRDMIQSLYRVRNITGKVHMYTDESYPNYMAKMPLCRIGIMKKIKNDMKHIKSSLEEYKVFLKYHHQFSFERLLIRNLIEDKLEMSFNSQMFKPMLDYYLKESGYKVFECNDQSKQRNISPSIFQTFNQIEDLTEDEIGLLERRRLKTDMDNSMKIFKYSFKKVFDWKRLKEENEDLLEKTFQHYVKDNNFRTKISFYKKMKSHSIDSIVNKNSSHIGMLDDKLRVYKIYQQIETFFKDDVKKNEEIDLFFNSIKSDFIKLKKVDKSVKSYATLNQFLKVYSFQKIEKLESQRVQVNKKTVRVNTYQLKENEIACYIN